MEISLGQEAVYTHTFTQAEFDRFAALSGDDNPIHVDPAFSAGTRFGRTVSHGMLLYSHICRGLGQLLPGPGTVQVEQELMFPAPTFVGDEIRFRLAVTGLPEPGLAELSTLVTRPDGETSVQGTTRVRLPGSGSPLPAVETPQPARAAAGETTVYKGLSLGQSCSLERTFTPADLAEYIALTGDDNPAYRAPRLPGGLLGGLFSYLLGTRLPGRGTNWLKQKLAFPAPAHPGEPLLARVEIARLRPEKDLVNLATTCTAPGGRVVCRGEALVLVKDLVV